MGCDIHGVVQRRQPDGTWATVGTGYNWRNYNAFAVLANVRNARGFAGAQTAEEPFTFIQENRGLPADFPVNDEGVHCWETVPHEEALKRLSGDDLDECWMGDHSHGWVTGAELRDFDFGQTIRQCGYLPEEDYLEWRKGAPVQPPNYSSWAGGGQVLLAETDEEYERAKVVAGGYRFYVRVWWEHSYAEAVGEEFTAFARELAAGGEDVRFVFGFDS